MYATRFQQRPDIAPDVVHFTKGESVAAAFLILKKILGERRLQGGLGFIRSPSRCVCFTEAPLTHLCEVFRWSSPDGLRYKPFGIVVSKRWLFERGGRPVIYQTEAEYDELPEGLGYRHVRYEPASDPVIDFTWEREWRIRTESLELEPSVVRVVVPSSEFYDDLLRDHNDAQDSLVQQYAQAVGAQQAEMYRDPFPWTMINLEELRPDWHFNQDRSPDSR